MKGSFPPGTRAGSAHETGGQVASEHGETHTRTFNRKWKNINIWKKPHFGASQPLHSRYTRTGTYVGWGMAIAHGRYKS
jgi:hypothetical protein